MMLFADSFEDIEALGTLDLIRRAKIEIDTVSITGSKVVLTQSKVNVMADKLIEEINLDDYDFLIIPGGAAVMKTHLNSPITESIAMYFYKKHALIGCICAAPPPHGWPRTPARSRSPACGPGFPAGWWALRRPPQPGGGRGHRSRWCGQCPRPWRRRCRGA